MKIGSLHKLFLLITLLSVVHLIHISQQGHQQPSQPNFFSASFPLRLRIVANYDPYMGMRPNEKGSVNVTYLRGHNEFYWTVHKNTDGTYKFQAYDGKYLSCPNNPGQGMALQFKSAASVINQNFIIQIQMSQQYVYAIRCAEPYSPFVGTTQKTRDGAQIALYPTLTPAYDLWRFKID